MCSHRVQTHKQKYISFSYARKIPVRKNYRTIQTIQLEYERNNISSRIGTQLSGIISYDNKHYI